MKDAQSATKGAVVDEQTTAGKVSSAKDLKADGLDAVGKASTENVGEPPVRYACNTGL